MNTWPLSRILRWCAISFLIGVASTEWIGWSWISIAIVVWVGIIACALTRKGLLFVLGCCIVVCSLGMARSYLAVSHPASNDVSILNETATHAWTGVIVREPDVRETRQKLVVQIDTVDGGHAYTGTMLVDAPVYPWFSYGDQIQFRCKTKEPFVAQGFSYKDYLARQSIFSWCKNPTPIVRIGTASVNPVYAMLYSVKQWLLSGINAVLPEPHSTLMAGILFGARSGFPAEIANEFSIVGLTHIVAVSGYNITLVMVAIASLLKALGLGRKQSTWIALVSIALFTIFTGAASSALRAAIMGGLVLISRHMGRSQSASHSLLLTAVVMVALSPSILVHDAGFQLSFLATVGLLYGTDIVGRCTAWIHMPKIVKETLDQTIAATLATAPLIAVVFSSFSVIALVANILILPVSPLIMGLGLVLVISNIIGSVLGPLSGIWHLISGPIAWLCWLVLEYILKTVDILSHIPYASLPVQFGQWSWVFFVLAYAGLIFGVWAYGRIYEPSNQRDAPAGKSFDTA